ncbi:conserved hypothetical protein [Leishmania infantum JPCM5]|uniref:Uncharacterized protein n=2 Tax=Leishmania infantum TaxID=5671 RepID=A4I379_LEIIN|nr:conserved hypothetical protein [Leishmania infantum JPCM5]CAC9501549.1 hypothetical_protein_-_conserved [Leishmania infantum]CAM69233.1 conserved hypothetical protein [Leishmania infantum JPCM5]SUZ43168.1 hypothetical_protein_-_conserved [Leishmania infantum]|eukprot:XP_001470041.1 conserved hypothetical protein [Leishmania infantum JPCM5]
MRRLGRRTLTSLALTAARRWIESQEPCTAEAIRELLQQAEKEQERRELAVDQRKVVFTAASSGDHHARIAAAETFDVAAAGLPRPPNFCYMNVSVDFACMVDAPEVVWFNMCKANGFTPSSVKAGSVHMLGGMVCHQRLGGGYIQVILGCIPDLETDSFTFDAVPDKDEIAAAGRAPPAVAFAMLDAGLTLQYEQVLSAHLSSLSSSLGKECPLVGGLYPPVGSVIGGGDPSGKLEDSIFFINDRVYRGSAAAVVLRSKLLKAHSASVVPSISLGSASVTDVACEGGVATVRALNNRPAMEVVKEVYSLPEIAEKPSKVFLGLRHGDVHVPVSFVGHPDSGELSCTLPPGISLVQSDTVDFLVDDVELDTEMAASLLINMEKRIAPIFVEKDINVAREARRNIVASSTAAFHFSHGGLNTIAKPEVPAVSLGSAGAIFAPSILQRCVGRSCPNAGFFSPGQVATVADLTSIFPRSSTYCFMQGTE